MAVQFHRDGSFDIRIDGFSLTGAYPAIDGVPLRPVCCSVNGNEAVFALAKGTLTLRITESGQGIRIRCHVTGLTGAHDVSPIAHAGMTGCTRVFRQGFGIGGPSGFASPEDALHSDALIGLLGNADCCALYAKDHSKYRIHYAVEKNQMSAFIDLEGTDAEDLELPELFIVHGGDISELLTACAKDIACTMGARTPTKAAFHWCSWYYLYHNLNSQVLKEYLQGFVRCRDVAPFSHIQVDAGYFPSVGDWLEPHPRYPGGLEQVARDITAAGFEPGIWVGPFMVGDCSKLFREHPDWMLRHNDGSYVSCWKWYNEPKPWGYRDSDYYVLDTSHPEAMAYIVDVFRTLRSWGYTLYKTDFLIWGMQDSTKVKRHTPGKTSFEYFRELMMNIREAIGEDSAWLGCISPFMPAIGCVDMMRIAGDVGAQWSETNFGPVNMIQEVCADQYFSNIYWQNDPDAVFLRDFHIHLKPHQVEALAILQAMSGGVITTSDPVHELSPVRQALLRLIRPRGLVRSHFPYWQDRRDDVIITADAKQGKLAYFFNPTPRDMVIPCDWVHILGDDSWHLRQLHGGASDTRGTGYVAVPAQSGVLFFASRQPLACEPANLWDWQE